MADKHVSGFIYSSFISVATFNPNTTQFYLLVASGITPPILNGIM